MCYFQLILTTMIDVSKKCTCILILKSITEIHKIYYLVDVKRFVTYNHIKYEHDYFQKESISYGVRILHDIWEFVSSITTTHYLARTNTPLYLTICYNKCSINII